MRADPFDLDRFMIAQAPVYDVALAELIGGRKVTHWMWFIFPQLRGLGRSSMARRFGIDTLEEARAYLQHPVLGARLTECTHAVLDCGETDLRTIFGTPDDMKFISAMTLFSMVSPTEDTVFATALARLNGAAKDPRTLELLEQ